MEKSKYKSLTIFLVSSLLVTFSIMIDYSEQAVQSKAMWWFYRISLKAADNWTGIRLFLITVFIFSFGYIVAQYILNKKYLKDTSESEEGYIHG